MSIVTLKKKTQSKYNNVSVGQKQFSLNGTHRSQGFIGQDTLGRSLPRTPYRGVVAQGHGGCCGKYPTNVNVLCGTGTFSTNNPNVVKPSVINTRGMLFEKFKGRNNVVSKGPLFNVDYSIYMDSLNKDNLCYPSAIRPHACPCASLSPLFKTSYKSTIAFTENNNIIKDVDTMDQSSYIASLKTKC